MRATDKSIVMNIINDLINTNKTHKEIANEYSISTTLVENINECKAHTNLHEYKKNIRKESKGENLNVINEYELKDGYYLLKIIRTDKKEILTKISIEDYPSIKEHKWSFKIDSNKVYRVLGTSAKVQRTELSRWLFPEAGSNFVDHINRDTLDNRRENLRIVSRSINSTNAKARTESKTGIRGVYKRKARPGIAHESWVAEWSDSTGRHSKSFSCTKYGEEEAFRLAYSLRQQKLEEMKI